MGQLLAAGLEYNIRRAFQLSSFLKHANLSKQQNSLESLEKF